MTYPLTSGKPLPLRYYFQHVAAMLRPRVLRGRAHELTEKCCLALLQRDAPLKAFQHVCGRH
jgi:hypothetical protein